MYKLFIDDERFPVDKSFIIARTSDEAIRIVSQKGIPSEIAFDHDLGGIDTSMRFIRWLENGLLDKAYKFPKKFKFSVHSQNPVGAGNIRGTMRGLVHRFSEK